MQTIYEDIIQFTKFFGPAEILSFDKSENTAVLKIQNNGIDYNTIGKIAVPNCPELSNGDLVLAAGNALNNLFIIGLLEKQSLNKSKNKKLITTSGAHAALIQNNENEIIRICTSKGELIFEYDSVTNRSKVIAEEGDIEFNTKGRINFVSGQDINFSSRQSINIETRVGFQISVKDFIGNFKSLFSLNQRRWKMSSPEMNLTSQKIGIQTEQMKYIGTSFSAVLKEGKMIVGKIETVANDIISSAKNLYNSIEELTQTRTGRMRTLIKSTLHIKSKNSYLNSEEDFKINAEKIHLG